MALRGLLLHYRWCTRIGTRSASPCIPRRPHSPPPSRLRTAAKSPPPSSSLLLLCREGQGRGGLDASAQALARALAALERLDWLGSRRVVGDGWRGGESSNPMGWRNKAASLAGAEPSTAATNISPKEGQVEEGEEGVVEDGRKEDTIEASEGVGEGRSAAEELTTRCRCVSWTAGKLCLSCW